MCFRRTEAGLGFKTVRLLFGLGWRFGGFFGGLFLFDWGGRDDCFLRGAPLGLASSFGGHGRWFLSQRGDMDAGCQQGQVNVFYVFAIVGFVVQNYN